MRALPDSRGRRVNFLADCVGRLGPSLHPLFFGAADVFKSIGSTWILNLLQIVVLMRLTPFVIDTLGKDHNGLWITIVSLTGILSLLILGVPMASVRFIAQAVAQKDVARTNAAISTCLGICAALGALALITGVALYPVFDSQYLATAARDGFTPASLNDARIAYAVVVAQVSLGFVMRLPYGIFDAHHDFVRRNAIMAGELGLRFVLTLTLLELQASLLMLALVQVGCMLAEFTVAIVVLKRRYPEVRFGLASFDRTLARGIFGFSVFAMLLNVGTLLAFRADALVIGARLDPEQVTFFDMGNKFFDPLTGILIAVAAVVMPTATKLSVAGETGDLRHLYLKWSKISFSLVLLVGIYLLVLGPEFLGWWVGPEFSGPSGKVLQVLMISFLFYLPVRGVALPILMGLGKPAWPAFALLVMGAVNLALSLFLVRTHGIVGVALGTAIPNVLFAAAVLWRACREVELRVVEWLNYVTVRATLGALVPLGLLLWLKYGIGVAGLMPLVMSGLALVGVFALVWILFVYRHDPYLDTGAILQRLNGRLLQRRTP